MHVMRPRMMTAGTWCPEASRSDLLEGCVLCQAARAERLRDLEFLGNKAQEAANATAKELQGSQAALREAAKFSDTRDAFA